MARRLLSARRAGLAAWLLLALVPAALADEVILDDGSVIRGEVLDLDAPETLRVAVMRGTDRVVVEIKRARVRFVRQLNGEEERLSQQAEEALISGDALKAITLYERLTTLRPKDARAHRELGFALLLANRTTDALGPLEEACVLDGLDLEAHLELAQAHERLGHVDAAVDVYRRATRIGPKHVVAWRALAQLLLIQATPGSRAEALDCFRRAAKIDPNDAAVVLEWAAALLATDPKAARARLEEFAARRPGAARVGRALAQLDAVNGDFSAAANRLADLVARGVTDEIETIEAELALYRWLADPSSAPSPGGTDAGRLPPGALDAADRRLQILMEALPDDGRLQLAVARLRLRTGAFKDARAWLERAALSGPAEVAEDALLLQQVAGALQRAAQAGPPEFLLGDSPSEPRAQRLVRLVPWLEASHRTLGAVLEGAGAFTRAAEAYAAGAKAVTDPGARQRLVSAAAEASRKAAEHARNRGL